MRYVGARLKRVEDPRILTGRGRYFDDLPLAGIAHSHFVRSPFAHARIRRVDLAAARRAPGVLLVLDGAAAAGLCTKLSPPESGGLRAPCHPALTADRARFVGDPVALIVAESRGLAEDAADLVEVDYEPLEVIIGIDSALASGAVTLWDDMSDNVLWEGQASWGDVESAFLRASHVIRETFTQDRHTCLPLECRGGVAAFDPGSGELTYTISHQNPHAMRMHLAAILGLPASSVRVRLHDVGGSFGLKSHPSREDVAICLASMLVARPVKWVEDRVENLVSAGHARDERIEVEAAVDADGVLIGLRAKLSMDAGAYPLLNIPLNLFANIIKILLPGTLRLRNYAYSGRVVATNKASYVAYRGPWEIECWVRERLLDRIGRELDIDPVDVRRRNLMADEAYPCRMLTGATLEFMTINQTLDRAVEAAGYDDFRRQQALQRRAGRYTGIGICTYLEPGPGPTDYSQALGFSYEQRSFQRARVKVEIDGTVTVFTSQQPHGQSHETTLAQVAADELGVAFADVRIIHGDTDLQPFNLVATGGSRAATLASGAITGAARIVRAQLIDAVAHLLEADPADLDIDDGRICVKGSPDRFRTFADVARLSFLAPLTLPPSLGLGLDATFDFETPPGGWTQSTHVCWVEIDVETGIVVVPRYLVVEDCGRMINPAVVDGQIRGGVAQGIGAVLYERVVYDDQGQPLSSTLMDYLAPTAAELPRIDIEHLEGPIQGDIPYRGVGEGGAIGAPAALTNAIEDALAPFGVKVTEQHLPPARILELIGAVQPADG
jgi:carbon-monoxide dehydrogenase large subunit